MEVHEHCDQCYNINCRIDTSNNEEHTCCEVIECPSGCKTSLHTCKVAEHQSHVCASYVIDCINSSYGCPHRFPRHKLTSHLYHCPASVITCHHEWNRWCRGPSAKPSLSSEVSGERSSDLLDVSLAVRDQRIFHESLKMPSSLRQALQNTYTRNFPAVPFLQRIAAADSDNQEEPSINSFDFLADDDSGDVECRRRQNIPGTTASYHRVNCGLCRARRGDEGLADSITSALNQVRKTQQAGDDSNSTNVEEEKRANEKQSQVEQPSSNASRFSIDLVMEMFNSFRPKPLKMLTFLCAQDFRRDQFANHYLTVHSDIQTGLNGWYQTRCPLSCYGCRFTQHRFVTDRKEEVVYNPVTDSLCVKGAELSEYGDQSGADMFSTLPDLVVFIVFSYLDSLSLKNVSMTSKVMRDKCSYLLTSRGMVILDWKKINGVWRSNEKVWSFSNAFERPRRWIFADRTAMAEHLRSCPYNLKHDKFTKEASRVFCLPYQPKASKMAEVLEDQK